MGKEEEKTAVEFGNCGVRCDEVLAPIPGERWECVGVSDHGTSHVAVDGTTW